MLKSRIEYFTCLFELIQETGSRIEKEQLIKNTPLEYKEDLDYILECLAGKHVFGFKYYSVPVVLFNNEDKSVKFMLELLQMPISTHNLSQANIRSYIDITSKYSDFFEPIVNRTLKLGIGNSLLEKSDIAPMLAKKFEGDAKISKRGYFITEKLDGNRCIASYVNGEWTFTSRSGKAMNVNFNMSGLNKSYTYDGEILAPSQVAMSNDIYNNIMLGAELKQHNSNAFNSTSGLINSNEANKNLVYNIFDIMTDEDYYDRRLELDNCHANTENVRILPVLQYCKSIGALRDNAKFLLNKVTSAGGEGVMINIGDATYTHKRTDSILKFKKTYTMDMQVYDIEYGSGKYLGQVGALLAQGTTEDGKHVYCSVGTGLSDEQRLLWATYPTTVLGKIIEVTYFSLSQSKNEKNIWSLRFPRLKQVRDDKTETSVY